MMKKILSEIKFDLEFIRGHTLQPAWYKILKVFLMVIFLGSYYWLYGPAKTLLFCAIFFGLSLVVHILYRVKTARFTRSWLDFVVNQQGGQPNYQRIGIYYYLMVGFNFVCALVLSQVLL